MLIKQGRNQTEALEAGHLATKTHLSLDFVRTWRERLAEFVDQVRTLYGSKPPILYRLMQLTDQVCALVSSTPYSLVRLMQIALRVPQVLCRSSHCHHQ